MKSLSKKATKPSTSVLFDSCSEPVIPLTGETLLDCARRAAVRIESVCGGRGICKSCIVRLTDSQIPPPSPGDTQFFSPGKLEKGWRRACQVLPSSDCRVHIPTRMRAASVRHQLDGRDFWINPEPIVEAFLVPLGQPTVKDPVADADRLLKTLGRFGRSWEKIDSQLLTKLPRMLRDHDWTVLAVTRLDEVIAVLPANTPLLGLAVDLGTTNIGVFLVDLNDGSTVGSAGIENPQSAYGGDVVSRTAAAKLDPDKALDMQHQVVHALNDTMARLCNDIDLAPEQIVDIVVAGNTVMHHLILGLPVDNLGVSPFVAAVNSAVNIKARDLGLSAASGCYIHVMPNIAGYVGGDHTAMLLGIRADEEARTVMALDIGTNTEISLIHQGQITCLSCPSGPALEGGNISAGMRAARGAIETVRIEDGEVKLGVIGDDTPLGLCGSGVIDAVAAFHRSGGISSTGRIDGNYAHARGDDRNREIVLHLGEPDVVFTQDDVRSVQLAKGAVRAGIELLLEDAKIDHRTLDRVVIAGAFGTYINIDSARTIGMLPDLPDDRYEQVGNAAGIGTKLALLSGPLREQASRLASKSRHIELVDSASFNSRFMKFIGMPVADIDHDSNQSVTVDTK